jgi:hypothetical protein
MRSDARVETFDAELKPLRLDRAARRRIERAMRCDQRRGVGSTEDSAFFKTHPDRHHRLRLATAGEIEAFDAAEPRRPGVDGYWWWIAIKQIAVGERAMVRIYAPPPPQVPDGELSERLARMVFDVASAGRQS